MPEIPPRVSRKSSRAGVLYPTYSFRGSTVFDRISRILFVPFASCEPACTALPALQVQGVPFLSNSRRPHQISTKPVHWPRTTDRWPPYCHADFPSKISSKTWSRGASISAFFRRLWEKSDASPLMHSFRAVFPPLKSRLQFHPRLVSIPLQTVPTPDSGCTPQVPLVEQSTHLRYDWAHLASGRWHRNNRRYSHKGCAHDEHN